MNDLLSDCAKPTLGQFDRQQILVGQVRGQLMMVLPER